MGLQRKVITAAEMDAMTPQERADAVGAGTVRSWDDVDPTLREEILATARQLGTQRRSDA